MTWTKLSDDFPIDCRDLSDAAFRTHVEALVWVMLRDGDDRLDQRDVRRFAESPDADQAVKELLREGFWETADDGFRVVHHIDQQPTTEEIAARRAKDAERQQRSRKHKVGDHSMCKPDWCPALKSQGESRRDSQHESRSPDPTRPVPSRPKEEGRERAVGPGPADAAPATAEEDVAVSTSRVDRRHTKVMAHVNGNELTDVVLWLSKVAEDLRKRHECDECWPWGDNDTLSLTVPSEVASAWTEHLRDKVAAALRGEAA